MQLSSKNPILSRKTWNFSAGLQHGLRWQMASDSLLAITESSHAHYKGITGLLQRHCVYPSLRHLTHCEGNAQYGTTAQIGVGNAFCNRCAMPLRRLQMRN